MLVQTQAGRLVIPVTLRQATPPPTGAEVVIFGEIRPHGRGAIVIDRAVAGHVDRVMWTYRPIRPSHP